MVPPLFLLFLLLWKRVLLSSCADHHNKRVSVTEQALDSSVEDIQWCGQDLNTVLLKTSGGRLYQSRDAGRAWTEITSILNPTAGKSAGVIPEVLAESMLVNPANKNIVLVVGSKHAHYISEDAGRNFRRIEHRGTIHNWVFHPSKPHWALLSTWTEACTTLGGRGPDEPECNHMLYVTKDLGRNFRVVSTYIIQFSWGDPHHGNEDRIFFTHHRQKSGRQPRSGGWLHGADFAYTDDFGHHVRNVVAHGNKFHITNGYIFVATLVNHDKQLVTLMVSTDGGQHFSPAKLPTELQEKSYTILDTSEGAVMIHVNHGDALKESTGNVYISDTQGIRYSLSLPNSVRSQSGDCEFDRVQGLSGIYLANFKDDASFRHEEKRNEESHQRNEDDEYAEDFEDMWSELESEFSDEFSDDMDTLVDKHLRHKGKVEDPVRTVISFDKGGFWSYLTPPRVDSQGKPIQCPNPTQCWLHLHGITNFQNFAPFYSVENAIGVIMATGNVGSHLRYEEDEINTYLSTDGGLTWVEAHKGAYIFEFGDHGGLLVMADDVRSTNQVVFSWNMGQSWYDFDLGQYPVEVDNIVIEPNSSSVEFLLYGTRDSVGVVFHLDFSALEQPPCKGVWAADSVSSDYETWTPSDGRHKGEHCLLGRMTTYTRRKASAECFNGKDFERPKFQHNCECTEEDYECEFGFRRNLHSLECHPDMSSPDILRDFCRTSHYYKTDAYRKVPGDSCEGGWQPQPVLVPCPHHSPFSRGAKSILGSLLLMGILIGAVTIVSNNTGLASYFFNLGFDSFKSVHYQMVGGKKPHAGGFSAFDDDDDYDEEGGSTALGMMSRTRPSNRSKQKSHMSDDNYEPELGFIDSAKEEDMEEAPTLMNLNYSYREPEDDDLFDLNAKVDGGAQRRPGGLAAATEAVPRLAPPPTASAASTVVRPSSAALSTGPLPLSSASTHFSAGGGRVTGQGSLEVPKDSDLL